MPLDDLRDFLEQPTLTLPIGGKQYVIHPVTAKVWLELQAILEDAGKGKQTIPDIDLYRKCLGGDVLDAMIENGVTGPELRQAGVTANLWQLNQQELAEAFWRSGGKAPTPQGEQSDQPQTATPTRTAGATTTRKRASRSTTTTRQKNKPDVQG